jgi:hypothetical protein
MRCGRLVSNNQMCVDSAMSGQTGASQSTGQVFRKRVAFVHEKDDAGQARQPQFLWARCAGQVRPAQRRGGKGTTAVC